MQLGHDDLGRAAALGRVHVHGNPAAVVTDRNTAIGVDLDVDLIGMTGQRLVNGIKGAFGAHQGIRPVKKQGVDPVYAQARE